MSAAHMSSGSDGEDHALVFDRDRSTRLLVLPALFDEANKLRHFTVEVMRRLDRAGIDCFLPDLPGCNESRAPLDRQTLADWREAARKTASRFAATHVLTVRGGALCAPAGLPIVSCAPATGTTLLRGLLRARVIADREAGIGTAQEALVEHGRQEGIELAGYRIGAALFRELEAAEPGGPALANIAQSDLGGPGLWLRAEPDHSPEQADALAARIAEIIAPQEPSPLQESGLGEWNVAPAAGSFRQGETRRHITFPCENDTLAGTLDSAPGTAGLLIVTGGNEVRSGAFSSQARLASAIAAAGYPVFRFDRRGVGDSEGDNRGYRGSASDIAAALAAFREAAPHVRKVVAYGNCDAASALMLGGHVGLSALVVSNPWTCDDEQSDAPPPPEAIRSRYAGKLRNPRELWRLLKGEVSLTKLARGLAAASRSRPKASGLAERLRCATESNRPPVRILLSGRDRTAQVFLVQWNPADPRLRHCATASHAFAEPEGHAFLLGELTAVLHEQARQLDMG